jgi:hypothetical protein
MATIANCPVPFRFQYPKLWKNLELTDDSEPREESLEPARKKEPPQEERGD